MSNKRTQAQMTRLEKEHQDKNVGGITSTVVVPSNSQTWMIKLKEFIQKARQQNSERASLMPQRVKISGASIIATITKAAVESNN